MIYLGDVAQVKVAYTVKVHVTTIIPEGAADLLTISKDATLEILLTAFRYLADLEISVKTISFVVEFKFAGDLLIECSHHGVVKLVGRCIAKDCLTIMKSDFFMTSCINRN